ncbi:glycosyltransferase family 2 protein [Spiribacter sp. 1M153]|uniref:glycosyltransferase family 2 protein n=1 Tax=Spiribacter roseus TaxID=1855875 RepID=UPI00349F2440
MTREDWLSEAYVPSLVSVIIPTFDRRHFLHAALESVFAQDYRPIEAIVIDDGSSDGTHELIKSCQKKHQSEEKFAIRYAYQKNKGAAVARNNGLRLSRGEYVQFLDSDDLLLPDKLSTAINIFNAHPEVEIVYANRGDFSRDVCDFRPWVREHADLEHDPSPAAVALANVWTPLPLFTRKALSKVGPWDERLSSLQDWEYIARVVSQVREVRNTGKIQALCRTHEGSRLSVSPWGEAEGVEANAMASAALYPLVAACYSPHREEALIALARRILSCLRVSIAAGNYRLALEIAETHHAPINAHRETRWRAWFWLTSLYLPHILLDMVFSPVRALKKRQAAQQVKRQPLREAKG